MMSARWGPILEEEAVSLHEQLYQYTSQGGLDASSARRLWQLSGQGQAPEQLWMWLRRGAVLLAAGLAGFGVMLWVAANWDTFTRFQRFALLQSVVVLAVVGAWISEPPPRMRFRSPASIEGGAREPGDHVAPDSTQHPPQLPEQQRDPCHAPDASRTHVRAALALLAFLTLGGVLAYFGQTYQTGADAWNLFALWAALSLPLVAAISSDLLWAPWQIVTSLAISLWSYTYGGHDWSVGAGTLPVHAIALGLSLLLIAALALHGKHSGQWWAWRLAVLTANTLALTLGVMSLFRSTIAPQYGLVVGLYGLALALGWWRRQVFVMSVAALALNVLLIGGWVHGRSLRGFEELLVVAGLAALLLAGSVQLIMHRTRAPEAA